MIKHLAARHSVTVATLAHNTQELQEGDKLHEYCDELMVEVLPTVTRWRRAFLGLLTSKPSSAQYFWSPRLAHRIVQASRQAAFDRVWVHCAFMARYVADLPCDFKVLDYGDIDSSKWADYKKHRSFPLSLGYGWESRKLRRHEREMGHRFTRCTVTTSSELLEFESLGISKPCTVIPNGVDIDYFTARQGTDLSKPTIVFVGRMDYFPNVDGMTNFVSRSWPSIRAAVPEAELRVVGLNPVVPVQRLARLPGIQVTGHVPDIRPYAWDAAVGIAPLRIARGTQNKVLEMMAMGIPVVATAEAARGIRAQAGEHLLVASTRDEFVRDVIELLRNRELGRRLALAARAQVVQAHSWPASMAFVDDVLELGSTADIAAEPAAAQIAGSA